MLKKDEENLGFEPTTPISVKLTMEISNFQTNFLDRGWDRAGSSIVPKGAIKHLLQRGKDFVFPIISLKPQNNLKVWTKS